MTDPFVHLRVASAYSLQYGAAQPATLVERATSYDMDTLALTDRDGLYGAIRFAKACRAGGIAPVVGVDLATRPDSREVVPPRPQPRRAPLRGGVSRSADLPRVVVLATSGNGWTALCRLVSEIHLGGARGRPVARARQIADHAAAGHLVVVLGADSEFGLAVHRRPDLAEECLRRWQRRLPADALVVGVTDHLSAGEGPGSSGHAARMLALADRLGVPAVLTNAVRMAERTQAPVVDVLDCARRLVPLSAHNVHRYNAEAWLKSGKDMLSIAEPLAQRAGRGRSGAGRLIGDTRLLALRCRLDPSADLGLDRIRLPELAILAGGAGAVDGQSLLIQRCAAGLAAKFSGDDRDVHERLTAELDVIGRLGFAAYFLTVADIVDMTRSMGCRVAARGSGAGSLVNYLLGISGVDPMRHDLLMERFLSPLRRALPDIDLDVESHRREDIYRRILDTFGGERVACVAMMETYRVRHAVRDVGAALSLPPGEIDAIAKAFPHIRAKDARAAVRDLPELRAAGLAERRLDLLYDLVEALDGLPRHIALHPCGILLSDASLLDRTPVEASFGGFPMSQFDKDDVEDLGLLKLDVLGIRMQSAMSHAVAEIRRTTGNDVELDELGVDGYSDPATYDLIASARTLGCFQIESPGQRELIGKFGPASFSDLIIDISLFRPGPVKSDMIRPFLDARQGWDTAHYLHPDLKPILRETCGVVVFHEQVIRIIAQLTGCSLAEADEVRRNLGDPRARPDIRAWFLAAVANRGYAESIATQAWSVLQAFGSFGFCKAHAAAFALPTYQSAWLKTHWPAHFLAGVLTHDPGMYPKRLILEEVRRCGVEVLRLDVNRSADHYRVESVSTDPTGGPGENPSRWGVRLSLADVKGINAAELARILAGRPYRSLTDFWNRASISTPVTERLVLAGAFDQLHRIRPAGSLRRRNQLTRRDLLLAVADLDRETRSAARAGRARGLRTSAPVPVLQAALVEDLPAGHGLSGGDPQDLARLQNQRPAAIGVPEIQLPLDFDNGTELVPSGLTEMSDSERVRAELDILGLDVSRHIIDFYRPLLDALGTTSAADLLNARRRTDLLVAGVKLATQTPPVRSGRRVVFLTLDDKTGPIDATFFEGTQGPFAKTIFGSWLLLVRGDLRRTGPRGVSMRADGCWDLAALFETWRVEVELSGDPTRGLAAVRDLLADALPGIDSAMTAPRKLWHSSPGSPGR